MHLYASRLVDRDEPRTRVQDEGLSFRNLDRIRRQRSWRLGFSSSLGVGESASSRCSGRGGSVGHHEHLQRARTSENEPRKRRQTSQSGRRRSETQLRRSQHGTEQRSPVHLYCCHPDYYARSVTAALVANPSVRRRRASSRKTEVPRAADSCCARSPSACDALRARRAPLPPPSSSNSRPRPSFKTCRHAQLSQRSSEDRFVDQQPPKFTHVEVRKETPRPNAIELAHEAPAELASQAWPPPT